MNEAILSIDPGTRKCGLVLVDIKSQIVIEGIILPPNLIFEWVSKWQIDYCFSEILLGNGTGSEMIKRIISEKMKFEIKIVEEKGSTLRSRNRYWELWPPKGLISLLPRGLILPPEELDAVAALVLAEDYLNRKFAVPKRKSFKTLL